MAFSSATFVERFALPLVAGGAVHVGRPLGQSELTRLEAEIDAGAGAQRLAEACARRATMIWPDPIPTSPDDNAARLLVGVHNTLFLSHPARAGMIRAGRGTRAVVQFTASCLDLGMPAKERVAVARHALIGRLMQLAREDVLVRFWAGRREYFGQRPPDRLVAWPRLRRVEQQQQVVRWLETEMVPEQRALLAKVLLASPLTDLLSVASEGRPPIDFVAVAPILARPRLARLVCHEYAAGGIARVEAALCLAFWRVVAEAAPELSELALVGRDLPPRRPDARLRGALRAVVGLVQYLVATQALGDEVQLPTRRPPQLGFGAVLVAAEGAGLLASGEALGEPELARSFAQGLAAAKRALGSALASQLAEALQLALRATAGAVRQAGAEGETAR